nr:transposase [Histophilus somni]
MAWRIFSCCSSTNTSRTCPCCGHIAKENRQNTAQFNWGECCYTETADLVGPMNVLTRGQAIVQA